MRPLRLSSLLALLNAALLLLAVAGTAYASVRILQRYADQQALARVDSIARVAREGLASIADEVGVQANLLAGRPTLARLLEVVEPLEIEGFLDRFRRAGRLDGCAVFAGDRLIVRSGESLPWEALHDLRPAATARTLHAPARGGGPMLLVAWADMADRPLTRVGAAVVLDDDVSARLSERVGSAVRLVERTAAMRAGQGTLAPLRSRARVADAASARRDDAGAYTSVLALRDPAGELVGFLEAETPTSATASSVRKLVRSLAALALVLGVAAAAAGGVLGRRLVRPIGALSESAERIGLGDLATPVPRAGEAEVDALAGSLEQMRLRLQRLTSDLGSRQAELRAVLGGIADGVFTVDRERRLIYLNPQGAELLGIRPEQALGRFCGDVLSPEGPGGERPCEEQCPIVHARFRGDARAVEHLRLADGRRRTVVITSSPIEGDRQYQVLRDETETEAARRLRDAVLANISHEFKTPLSAQLASLELLLDRLPDLGTEEIGRLVLSLRRGTLRLSQLVDNLLESVRIEAGESAVRRQPVALDEVVEEAVEMTRPLLEQKQQEILVELPYPLPVVQGDASRLTQLLVNLLANAGKFAPAGTLVRIGGETAPERVVLWVEDGGPGFPGDDPSLLFDRFVRSPEEEPEEGGMGLGLWIVKSVAERHGGGVEARRVGDRTRVSVTLPVEGATT
jgi:PAS domain S-box-containing protein